MVRWRVAVVGLGGLRGSVPLGFLGVDVDVEPVIV